MIAVHFGSIPMGSSALSGPTGQSIKRKNTFAEYPVTRGKPVLHDIGAELDRQTFDFFFSEEFCDPRAELSKLELAFALKTPLPLIFVAGGFAGLRYVVEALDIKVQKTNRSGGITRVEAAITLIEAPVPSLLGLISSIARAAAPALTGAAGSNPDVKN